MPDFSKRVLVSRPFMGLLYMQVCACKGATDEEILDVCNTENPAGTTNGWANVMRENPEGEDGFAPVPCVDDPSREHIVVAC